MSPVDVAVVGKLCMPKLSFRMKALPDLSDKSCNDGTVGIGIVGRIRSNVQSSTLDNRTTVFRSHIYRTSTMSHVDVAVVGKACMPTLFFQMKALADLPDKSYNDGTVGIDVVDCPFSSLPEFEPHTHR